MYNSSIRNIRTLVYIAMICSSIAVGLGDISARSEYCLNDGWVTVLAEAGQSDDMYIGNATGINWTGVNIPHNWDDYGGARQLVHGNLHGTAWYKKTFKAAAAASQGKRYFVRFEGVGTYATVILNGTNYGRRPAGRVTFTLDVTDAIRPGGENELIVKAEHPSLITDMPWVCGGCSSEWGFSEGSQPLGIFRPVVLEVTDAVRIEPFGVHIWNDEKADRVFIETEIKNYDNTEQTIKLVNLFNEKTGKDVFQLTEDVTLKPGEVKIISQSAPVKNPKYWSVDDAYLYTLNSNIVRDGETVDEVATSFGIRTISWPLNRKDGDNRFLLNGKPVFINGICEYEHILGQSHAFGEEQIRSRVKQMKAAGFNAFRDAHQPHNLLYQKLWDETGTLFWTQFSAHIWYDTESFRNQFKSLLRQWVKERRNCPSVVMWGLQNESVLPEAFAAECCEIIREMDPTTSSQRIITTCNGGKGTDWNVVQNWSGTYWGSPEKYGEELASEEELLNGEYGAWRSLGLHTEGGFEQKGVWSEDRMSQLMEMKVFLAESVKDRVCGQFHWLFNSHDNPGRRQPDEGYRVIDKIGPFNYKGLLTIWEEPLDVYYMYRANYVSAENDPMVYIVSHTWPDRFSDARKATMNVYSNCDEVELFNDAGGFESLGKRTRNGVGTHFVWEDANIQFNVICAKGYCNGMQVAEDVIVLDNLPEAPHFELLYDNSEPVLKGEPGYNYVYRVNCGGNSYTDSFEQKWGQDVALDGKQACWGSSSWADDYPDLNPYLASQRRSYDPIKGSRDWELFQSFRYGRHKLLYHFPVPDGEYHVELYFIEPWHGVGGSVDCGGLRIFDVAINGQTCVDDIDIWKQAGTVAAYKKVVNANVSGGALDISFPEVKAGQAVISAIAIASLNEMIEPAPRAPYKGWSWNNIQRVIKTSKDELPEGSGTRANIVYPAQNAKAEGNFTKMVLDKRDAVCFAEGDDNVIEWEISVGLAQVYALRFYYMNTTDNPVDVTFKIIDSKGVTLKNTNMTFPKRGEKWRIVNTTTERYINAGTYRIRLEGVGMNGLCFNALDVQ